MEANKILSADLLDILFEGRNKEYGAYDLRKNYGSRLGRSVLIMFSMILLVLGGNMLLGFITPSYIAPATPPDIILSVVDLKPPPEEKKIVLPPPSKQTAPPPAAITKSVILTKPLIVKEDPPENVKPPDMTAIENMKIGLSTNLNGKDYTGTMEGPVGEKEGVVGIAKKTEDTVEGFIPIQIESEYPGGPEAWKRYLERNLFNNYPQIAMENDIQGSVTIMFIVDVDGRVSDVTALSGPKELQPAAITTVRKSGKWMPAIQNGRKVKSYKKQVITFSLLSN